MRENETVCAQKGRGGGADPALVAWLSRYRELGRQVDLRCEELAQWRSRATRVTPSLGERPRGGGGDGSPLEVAVEHIVAIEEELGREIAQLHAARREIAGAVAAVGDSTLATLLEKRYLGGKTWEAIAEEMGYSGRHIHRLQKAALAAVGEQVRGRALTVSKHGMVCH